MSLDKKLYTVKCTPDKVSHLEPGKDCKECVNKACTFICPAQVYTCEDDNLIVNHENCLECGACRIACPCLKWKYPCGNKGVMFKHG